MTNSIETSFHLLNETVEPLRQDHHLNQLRAQLIEVAHATCGEQFFTTERQQLQVVDFYQKALTALSLFQTETLANIETRRENLRNYFGKLQFFSLGEDCLPRVVLTRWGFKPFAGIGEKSHPFDLAVHPGRAVLDAMTTNFADYLNASKLTYLEDKGHVYNPSQGVMFNHEHGAEFVTDDFSKFRSLYNRRIDQLRTGVETATCPVFVFHIQKPEDADRDLMYQMEHCLVSKWRLSCGKFVVLRTFEYGQHSASPSITHLSPLSCVIDVAYPFRDYVWHFPQHCLSNGGHHFERRIAAMLMTVLEPLYRDSAGPR